MVSCFFEKLIELFMIQLSEKMILKVTFVTHTVNITHAVFWLVS